MARDIVAAGFDEDDVSKCENAEQLVVSLAGALAVVKIPDGAPTSMVARLLSEQLPGVKATVDGDTIALETSRSILPVQLISCYGSSGKAHVAI